ncbi:MAG: phosphoribosylformimino-5-aminoimidazole carboxamide ribotide isomerase, partial [Clostridia bacterium]|nr:phosphoribosylformimino-5-aminoimidazole carboxamide ribotide isomerase [Clostridia bacterium]
FAALQDASFFADLYRKQGLSGGHVIMLNAVNSPLYPATKEQAMRALKAFPNGLQIGGGIDAGNAEEFLLAGASHVIVTSYIFKDGMIKYDHINRMRDAAGREKLVFDVSCRKRGSDYYIVTDRWQHFTEEKLTVSMLQKLSEYCSEFLIHAVDVEGKQSGIDLEIVRMLAKYALTTQAANPVTYAGGVSDYSDLIKLYQEGKGTVNVTIGSALDLFGGSLVFDRIVKEIKDLHEIS